MKKISLLKYSAFFIIIASFTHCARPYQFNPDPLKANHSTNEYLNSLVLSIEYFEDIRRKDPANDIYFNKRKKTHLQNENNSKKCINSEKNYKSNLIHNLTRLTAYHLKSDQIFKNVVYAKKHLADYYITAKLKNFRIMQDFDACAATREEIPSLYTPCYSLGSSYTIWEEHIQYYSRAKVLIQYEEVKLYSKDGRLIKEIALVENHEINEFPVDKSCWCAFRTAETSLLKINSILAKELISIIEAIEKSKKEIP